MKLRKEGETTRCWGDPILSNKFLCRIIDARLALIS